eukprot:CAMPEP_0194408304 /NCGR_PEP_ID=MMETSP0176-20130528/6223_1 /TAXON_ID=216777 /ORGANISM="Proboscia alata, Strain PI-D3" /LENGTH=887 /DNA_ID=CAMNT_0039208359 /DNA_START=177 /DNA_END=2840 /DNA_ORIENTATION=+
MRGYNSSEFVNPFEKNQAPVESSDDWNWEGGDDDDEEDDQGGWNDEYEDDIEEEGINMTNYKYSDGNQYSGVTNPGTEDSWGGGGGGGMDDNKVRNGMLAIAGFLLFIILLSLGKHDPDADDTNSVIANVDVDVDVDDGITEIQLVHVDQIVVLGSTTVRNLIRECYPATSVQGKLQRNGVFFQNSQKFTGYDVTNPKLVLSVHVNPYDWVERMRSVPEYTPNHVGLGWKDFVTREWSMERPARDLNMNMNMGNVTCQANFDYNEIVSCMKLTDMEAANGTTAASVMNPMYELNIDGSGQAYPSILELRRDKIHNHMGVRNWEDKGVELFKGVRYEDLTEREGVQNLLDWIASRTTLPSPECNAVDSVLSAIGTNNQPDGDHQYLNFVTEHAHWQMEKMLGYEPYPMFGDVQEADDFGIVFGSDDAGLYEDLNGLNNDAFDDFGGIDADDVGEDDTDDYGEDDADDDGEDDGAYYDADDAGEDDNSNNEGDFFDDQGYVDDTNQPIGDATNEDFFDDNSPEAPVGEGTGTTIEIPVEGTITPEIPAGVPAVVIDTMSPIAAPLIPPTTAMPNGEGTNATGAITDRANDVQIPPVNPGDTAATSSNPPDIIEVPPTNAPQVVVIPVQVIAPTTAVVPLPVVEESPSSATVPVTVVEETPPTATVPVAVVQEPPPTATVPVTVVQETPTAVVPVTVVEENPPTATVPVTVVEETPSTTTVPVTVVQEPPPTATVPVTVVQETPAVPVAVVQETPTATVPATVVQETPSTTTVPVTVVEETPAVPVAVVQETPTAVVPVTVVETPTTNAPVSQPTTSAPSSYPPSTYYPTGDNTSTPTYVPTSSSTSRKEKRAKTKLDKAAKAAKKEAKEAKAAKDTKKNNKKTNRRAAR